MHRLHGLSFAVVEQPVEILTRRVALRLGVKARADSIEELTQVNCELSVILGASVPRCGKVKAAAQRAKETSLE